MIQEIQEYKIPQGDFLTKEEKEEALEFFDFLYIFSIATCHNERDLIFNNQSEIQKSFNIWNLKLIKLGIPLKKLYYRMTDLNMNLSLQKRRKQ